MTAVSLLKCMHTVLFNFQYIFHKLITCHNRQGPLITPRQLPDFYKLAVHFIASAVIRFTVLPQDSEIIQNKYKEP